MTIWDFADKHPGWFLGYLVVGIAIAYCLRGVFVLINPKEQEPEEPKK